VHRDLKPENIMVDEEDNIKLIDFGIAGDAAARRLTYANFTAVLGTPNYISPGAGERQARRRPLRHLFHGRDSLRNAHRQAALFRPFAAGRMNERLLNHPIPPRVADPSSLPPVAGGSVPRFGTGSPKPICQGARLQAGSGSSGPGGRGGPPGVARLAKTQIPDFGARFFITAGLALIPVVILLLMVPARASPVTAFFPLPAVFRIFMISLCPKP
jgi:serine/threonine protein kinase